MSRSGPILLIEDDSDDKMIFEMIIRELEIPNQMIWFDNTMDAFKFLCTTSESPFLIFCDINLPGQNGLDFKKQVDDVPELRKKSIPFMFFSTTASQEDINEAYTQMTVQGFFKKGYDYEGMKNLIKTIFEYWTVCRHPNT
jgi:response regulator RpfG family c-di-GMP phosphodiesterase